MAVALQCMLLCCLAQENFELQAVTRTVFRLAPELRGPPKCSSSNAEQTSIVTHDVPEIES